MEGQPKEAWNNESADKADNPNFQNSQMLRPIGLKQIIEAFEVPHQLLIDADHIRFDRRRFPFESAPVVTDFVEKESDDGLV